MTISPAASLKLVTMQKTSVRKNDGHRRKSTTDPAAPEPTSGPVTIHHSLVCPRQPPSTSTQRCASGNNHHARLANPPDFPALVCQRQQPSGPLSNPRKAHGNSSDILKAGPRQPDCLLLVTFGPSPTSPAGVSRVCSPPRGLTFSTPLLASMNVRLA